MNAPFQPARRGFLKAGLAFGAGLTLGFRLDDADAASNAAADFAPNAFVRIAPDSRVTVIAKHVEFGQGAHTGLATLVAEELDADWTQVAVEAAPADASRYANLNWGTAQGTGGSSAMNNSWLQMREAGATARAMLVAAAAAEWRVPASEIEVSRGHVRHAASGRDSAFGALTARAATLPVPGEVTLKKPGQFVLIGKSLPRTDVAAKTAGRAQYTQDVYLPGMRTALVLHPPRFGATPASVDDAAARTLPGVHAVLKLNSGVAVVADGFWNARRARDALVVTWDERGASRLDSQDQREQYLALAAQSGRVVRDEGDVAAALTQAERRLEAVYELPYLAHASMEPMNCVVQLGRERAELWYGAQSMSGDQNNVAKLLGLAPAQVVIHQLYAGGSFGRRADPRADYVLEAVNIARALDDGQPLKLVWTREDDMRAGRYRPATTHALEATLDATGNPLAWRQRIVSQPLLPGAKTSDEKVDRTVHEGASDLAYAVPNLRVEAHLTEPGVPVLWWRSVGHTHTAFAVECFIDECAHAAGVDPFEYRRRLIKNDPRRLAVLERAAREAGWGTPLPAGHGRGIAVHRSFKTWVAEVVEVSTAADGGYRVERVTVAVDCGTAINPDVNRGQMEGGVGYALVAVFDQAITLEDGVVQQGNFDDFPLLRIDQMPRVDVHIVASNQAPTGVGEPGVPPLAPALANALFAATGKRLRRLPLEPGRAV